jgi:hypothetical protein
VKTRATSQRFLRPLSAALLLALLLLVAGPFPVRAEQATQQEGIPVRLRERIVQQNGDLWQVGPTSVRITPTTLLRESNGPAVVGAYVEVAGYADAQGAVTASEVTVLLPRGNNGPIVELSGVVTKITSMVDKQGKTTWFWVVGEQLVMATDPETLIIGKPGAGWLVWVVGVREAPDAVRALAIEAITADLSGLPVEFEGTIEAISATAWQVDGRALRLTPNTVVLGVPEIGAIGEVRATEAADGTLTALVVRSVNPAVEAFINALVDRITAAPNGTQSWSVTMFTGTGNDMRVEAGTIQVSQATYVEERRTALREGVYAEIDGQRIGANEVKAELVRLDRPTPITLSGPIGAPTTAGAGEFWTVGGKRVWSNTAQVTDAFRSAQASTGLRVSVRGVRLGNGVIWVQQAGAAPGNMR